jgi:hypothetical protein
MALPAASANNGTRLDRNQVLKKIFDSTNNGLKCVDAGTASGSHGTVLDSEQVWKMVFDPDNAALRVVLVT